MLSRRLIGAALTAAAIVPAVLLAAAPAQAVETAVFPTEAWKVRDVAAPDWKWTAAAKSKIVDCSTVDLTTDKGPVVDSNNYGTSIETDNLGIGVVPGDTVTVSYELKDGASAAAGAVRLFIYNTVGADTIATAPTLFDFAPHPGNTLTITVDFTGTIGTAGLVYDSSNGGVNGTVRFTNLMVKDTKVQFCAQPAATTEPTVTPTGLTTTANTGVSLTWAIVAGAGLVLAGAVFMILGRRRRAAA